MTAAFRPLRRKRRRANWLFSLLALAMTADRHYRPVALRTAYKTENVGLAKLPVRGVFGKFNAP